VLPVWEVRDIRSRNDQNTFYQGIKDYTHAGSLAAAQ
jgi:hypothetical protein